MSRSTKAVKVQFSHKEDAILADIVSKNKSKGWAWIADVFNDKCLRGSHALPMLRNERQCRDRWLNFLAPDVNRGPWTKEEDQLLLDTYNKLGPHWVSISKVLRGRKDTAIKNRYKLLQRRMKSKNREQTKQEEYVINEEPLESAKEPNVEKDFPINPEDDLAKSFFADNDIFNSYLADDLLNL